MIDYDYIVNEYVKMINGEKVEMQFIPVNGGIRNTTHKVKYGNQYLFIKLYNSKTKYSTHIEGTRCKTEYEICKYLNDNGCPVIKPVFCDNEKGVNIFKFYESKNLSYFLKNSDHKTVINLFYKIMDAIILVHNVQCNNYLNTLRFKSISEQDIMRYFNESFEVISKYKHSICVGNFYNDVKIDDLINCIMEENLVWGNMQMHSENIMICENQDVIFCDFEKTYPHFRQMDLISCLDNKGLSFEEIRHLTDYYFEKSNLKDYKKFIRNMDIINVIENLRMLKKITLNESSKQVEWKMQNEKKVKNIIADNSNTGVRWNTERNENYESRLYMMLNYNFSNEPMVNKLREQLEKLEL